MICSKKPSKPVSICRETSNNLSSTCGMYKTLQWSIHLKQANSTESLMKSPHEYVCTTWCMSREPDTLRQGATTIKLPRRLCAGGPSKIYAKAEVYQSTAGLFSFYLVAHLWRNIAIGLTKVQHIRVLLFMELLRMLQVWLNITRSLHSHFISNCNPSNMYWCSQHSGGQERRAAK